ncbi:Kri1 [Kluyveromyces lactis]|nr:Kri1 [Kluyveromyces lactis]
MPRKKSATKKAREAIKKQESVAEKGSSTKVPATGVEGKNTEVLSVKIGSKHDVTASKEVPAEVDDDDEDSSTSEEEDDYGELITEEVEEGIQKVLNAIKNNETDKLLNPGVKFFEEPEKAVEKLAKTEKHKPVYLKDYHRMNLLSGNVNADDDEGLEFETVDGKQSFASHQREERNQLLSEIKDAFNGDDDAEEGDEEEDGFLKKKEPQNKSESEVKLPNPKVDDEKFLQEFVNQQAWIPKKGDKVINLDRRGTDIEEDEDFDDAVEQFENAYNFRYEDPNAAEIVSYARTQATLRRSATSSRRRKRDEEKAIKDKEDEEKQKAVQKKKKEKVNQLTDVLEQVKKEYGADIKEEHVKALTDTLINGNFEDGKWDEVIGTIFNDEFYNQEDKPTWDENDDIMGEFYAEQETEDHAEDDETLAADSEEPKKKKSKKDKIQEKRDKKKDKKQLHEMVEKAVDERKVDIIEQVEEERGRSTEKNSEVKFRYREVSPESFGLTTREIFTADDADLNEFIGLKKFAPYRPKELTSKDRRKVTKSRRLREWRKKVFNNEEGLTGDELAIPLNDGKAHQTSKEKERLKNKKRKRRD